MDDKSRKFIGNSWIEMYESLNIAVDEAGGCGYSMENLREMTVEELFNRLATNGVRFICVKKLKPGRPHE